MGQLVCKNSWFGRKEFRILMHGLDAAGKTTILYRLKLGEIVTTIPTIGFNVETVTYKNVSLTAWDVGGRDKVRPLIRHYYPNTAALVVVIDSGDRERLEEIADEMFKLLAEEELRESVFLILANKQDLSNAMTVDEIKEKINYDKLFALIPNTRHNIFGCSAVSKEGEADLYKALGWLCDELSPPGSAWWTWPSGKTKNENEKEKDNEQTQKESSDVTKKPWTFETYIKDSLLALKSVLPRIW